MVSNEKGPSHDFFSVAPDINASATQRSVEVTTFFVVGTAIFAICIFLKAQRQPPWIDTFRTESISLEMAKSLTILSK
jgi:hypothetical protein